MKEMRNKSLKPPCLCLWLWGEPGLGSESPGHHRTPQDCVPPGFGTQRVIAAEERMETSHSQPRLCLLLPPQPGLSTEQGCRGSNPHRARVRCFPSLVHIQSPFTGTFQHLLGVGSCPPPWAVPFLMGCALC